ncbi:MAG: hypothetical protein WA628_20880 [Terriglobales bacterium]
MRTTILLTMLAVFGSCASVAQKGGARPPSPCTQWKAWHNLQPGTAPATLHVTAACHFPTSGYSVELVPAEGKTGTKVLTLRKVVHKPESMALQVISEVPLQYTVETASQYKEVRIKPDKVRVPVERVY